MSHSKRKIESFREIRDKSGHNFYEFFTSWWGLLFFTCIVGGSVLWNVFIPYPFLKFDPYPYNGLRTALALIGAIQAPLLLLYSRKSTEYRKRLLEQDYELEQKIFSKIESLEEHLKSGKENYIEGIRQASLQLKKRQRRLLKESKELEQQKTTDTQKEGLV